MVRTVIIPDKKIVSLEIPQDYIGREIEVIAFAKDEGVEKKQPVKKQVSFAALSIDTQGYRFNRDEANER